MLANTTQLKRVNSIDLAKDIEKIFHLDLHSLYTLPTSVQMAILAKAGHRHDLPRIAAIFESEAR